MAVTVSQTRSDKKANRVRSAMRTWCFKHRESAAKLRPFKSAACSKKQRSQRAGELNLIIRPNY